MVVTRRTSRSAPTRAKIVLAFLRLAVEKGIDSTTTRAVANEAGVTELTLFRHFGSKAALVRDSIREAALSGRLQTTHVDIDASSPRRASDGLISCLRFLRDEMIAHRDLVQFAMAESRRHPELREELLVAPVQAAKVLRQALRGARRQLRPEVDIEATALCLEGLIMRTVIWQVQDWARLESRQWNAILRAATRPLFRR